MDRRLFLILKLHKLNEVGEQICIRTVLHGHRRPFKIGAVPQVVDVAVLRIAQPTASAWDGVADTADFLHVAEHGNA